MYTPNIARQFRDVLEAIDHRQHRHQRHHNALQVERPGVGVAVLGQQPGAEHEQHQHHRHRHQEDGTPPEELQQHAAHQGADHTAHREAGNPHANGELALVLVVEHVADQGHRGRRERCAGDAQQRAHRDQHLGTAGERRDDRCDPERADQQQLATADAVPQRAHGDHSITFVCFDAAGQFFSALAMKPGLSALHCFWMSRL
jgi:hypothetical protein